jgi:WD40 repeat protein
MDFKFDAFISYRRSDGSTFARRLRRRLLDYRLPKALEAGPAPRRLSIYLDTIYERASEDFFANTIEPALRASRQLIVVQTPSALRPRLDGTPNWLWREIEVFRKLPQGNSISVALASGDFDGPLPANLREDFPNIEVVDCRRLHLRNPLKTDDQLLTFLARLHDIADERMPELRQEEARRRARRAIGSFAVAALLVVVLSVLLVWALRSRNATRRALANSDLRQAVALAESRRPAPALGYLARALRLDPENLASRSLAFDLLLRKNWPLPMIVLHHREPVTAAEFSPDGQLVVTASRDGTARLWDARSGRHLISLHHRDPVTTALFAPDGSVVLTAAGTVARLWDARTGAAVGQPMVHGGVVSLCRFSADSQEVLTVSQASAQVWSRQGQPLGPPMLHRSPVSAADISPDGSRAVTAAYDPAREVDEARLWDCRTARPLGAAMQHQDTINSVAFSPDGRRVLTGSEDNMARVWDALTGSPLTPLPHATLVRSAQFSPGGQLIVTTAAVSPYYPDTGAQVWNASTGVRIGKPMSSGDYGVSARFSPDGRQVATASSDGTARVWDAATGLAIGNAMTHPAGVSAVRFSPDGHRVVTVAGDSAWIWDVQAGYAVSMKLSGENPALAEFSPDGRYIRMVENKSTNVVLPTKIVGTITPTASVSSSRTGAPVGRPVALGNPALFLAGAPVRFSADSRRIMTVDGGGAHVFDARTGRPEGRPFPKAPDARFDLDSLRADGRHLVALTHDGAAQVWDVLAHQPVGQPLRQPGGITSALFSSDGGVVMTVAADATAWAWDAETGRRLGRPIASILKPPGIGSGWSRDGKWIVTGPAKGALQVWDVERGRPAGRVIRLREGQPAGALLSSDHRTLVTVLGQAQAWDVGSGESIGEPLPPGFSFDFSVDGDRITRLTNSIVQLWSASTGLHAAAPLAIDSSVAPGVEPDSDDEILPAFSRPGICAKFSPDGQRLLIGDGRRIQVVDVPAGSASDSDLLAALAEAVSGLTLTDLGTQIALPDREARFIDLRRIAAAGSGDSLILTFLRWFFADRSSRAVSPLSDLSVRDYISASLARHDQTERRNLVRTFSGHPMLAQAPQ